MGYELTGKVKVIGETQTFGSGFQKAELVVTVENGKYPQDINIEFCQDKISLLDALAVGDDVTVSFNLRGREYNNRYFNSVQGWRLSKVAGSVSLSEDRPTLPADVPAGLEEYQDSIPF